MHVTVSAEDFVDQNLTHLLGFLFMLFRLFSIQAVMKTESSSDDVLLVWVREQLASYNGIHVTNWSSFNDGKALLALVDVYEHRYQNQNLFDFNEKVNHPPVQVVTDALDLAETNMGLPKMFEPDALTRGEVEERNLILYVQMLFHCFIHAEEKRKNTEVHEQEIINLRNDVDVEITTLKERLEETLEQKIRMEHLYADLENKYKILEREIDHYVAESNEEVIKLETRNSDLELVNQNLKVELDNLRVQYDAEMKSTLAGIDMMRVHTVEHTRDLSFWAKYVKEEEGYEHPTDDLKGQIANLEYIQQLIELGDLLDKQGKSVHDCLPESHHHHHHHHHDEDKDDQ